MKKNIAIILLAVVVAVLLWFLLHEPKQPDSHNYQHDQAQVDNKIVTAQRNAWMKRSDSLELVNKSKDSLVNHLKAEKSAKDREIIKTNAEKTRLAKEVKELRRGDTSEFAVKADSLATLVMNYEYLYNEYKAYSDSIGGIMDEQKSDYVAALAEQKRLYDNLYSKYEQLYKLYEQLFKDYTSAGRSIKRERLKTKIAALLALVAGGAAVVK